ncbi:Alpha-amylase A type-1/2 [Pleodorina starrii]|uniref:alpha-amylase n=1 Tax=Pleodorina starrii TaxID=330485 RepID=A0A9W6BLV2_9CHLO|nr:Alpha-amylase A type-1/2 [Pleodorina starrii]
MLAGDFAYFAPDLDHTNQCVQEGLKDWLNWLKNDIGFEGFRFDMVKGYAPHFTKLYLEATGMANNSSLCVGEHYTANLVNNEAVYDQNPSRQAIVNWIDGTGGVCMAFDFPTKFILNATVKGFQPTLWRLIDPQGKPPGLMGWWPGKAVTFVENHDTEPVRNNGQDFPSSGLQLGYAYILTHPGTPCVFWRHMFDGDEGLKSAIRALMRTRTRNGITSESPITILEHDADLYMARIGNKLTVKLGPRYELGSRLPKESDGWHLACSGQNWAVWEKR